VLTPGAIHISMSTVSPGLSRRLAQQHGLAGQGYVAAPVLGNPDLAQARKLFIILAGLPSAVARISPVLQLLGQHSGAVAKLPREGAVGQRRGARSRCAGPVLQNIRISNPATPPAINISHSAA
jgi:3-hydroxyisobutyrate dehydrogenase-like beta-hydroxyacid dehydrogenase